MPVARTLRTPPTGTAEKLGRKLGGVKPRLTFVFPLCKNTETAIRVLQSEAPKPSEVSALLESNNTAAVLAGLNALKRMRKSSKKKVDRLPEKLHKLLEHGNERVEDLAAIELAMRPKMARKELIELLNHRRYTVRQWAAIELFKHPETTRQELQKWSNHEKWSVQEEAEIQLAKHPETTHKNLQELLKHEHQEVRKQAVIELAKHPEAKEELQELLEHADATLRIQAMRELIKHPQTTKEELHKLAKEEKTEVQKHAAMKLIKRLGNAELLGSGKPLFATPFTKKLSSQMKKIGKIVSELKRKYRTAFTGVIVVGSIDKGYFIAKSDLDYAVVASNKKIVKEFETLAEKNGLKPCLNYHIESPTSKYRRLLFSGLFFGDRRSLERKQASVVEKVSNNEWELIRKDSEYHEAGIGKGLDRFGLQPDETERIEIASRLLRVPPPLEEMREIMGRRFPRKSFRKHL